MNEPESVAGVLTKTVEKYNPDLQKKIWKSAIFTRWNKIVGNLANQIIPIKILDKTLVIYVANPAIRDTAKFLAADIINRINTDIGEGEIIIEKIRLGKFFEKPDENFDEIINSAFQKRYGKEKVSKSDFLREINLTDEEIAECENRLPELKNEARRPELLKTFLARAKLRKWRLKNGWHECKICGELCEPQEIICDFCKVHEREEMRKKIRRIFYDLPWSNFKTIQRKICQEMPHMKNECTLMTIESVWSSLVVETAARVSFGDKNSLDAKFLVMLFKQVNDKHLTDKLISRTLQELKFNLVGNGKNEFRKVK